MLTSDPSCSSTSKAEESGWTDCFSWDDLLYTGWDLQAAAAAAAAAAPMKRVSRSEACNYELIAADATLAKEARECLIADQYTAPHACDITALRVRQFHDDEQHQHLSVLRSKFNVDHGVALYNKQGYCIGASSMASDASSGPPSSSRSHHLMQKIATGPLYHDAGALLNTMRAPHSNLGVACKRARVAFHDSAVLDKCSKTRRITTQSNLHPSSSLSAAHPPATSTQQSQCSAAESCLRPASSHVMNFPYFKCRR